MPSRMSRLVVDAVVVDLEVEVLAERVLEPAREALGPLHVALDEGLRDDAGDAGGGDDEALAELLQPLEVDERAVVEALGVGPGQELVEVLDALAGSWRG